MTAQMPRATAEVQAALRLLLNADPRRASCKVLAAARQMLFAAVRDPLYALYELRGAVYSKMPRRPIARLDGKGFRHEAGTCTERRARL